MTLSIVIAPSGFKEGLEADEVAACIASGIRRVLPEANLTLLPLVDGGEGFSRILCLLTNGKLQYQDVTGPLGEPLESHFGFLGGSGPKTAVIEAAAAAGLRLMPHHRRNPTKSTTKGVGELIEAALDAGAERLLLGCDDSGANDAGAGAAQALGVRLLDDHGQEIGLGGAELARIKHIDLSARDPRLNLVNIEVACNWQNILCGPFGVTKSFASQKDVSSAQLAVLGEALEHFADVVYRDLGMDVKTMPGGGASGGFGAGLHALLGAKLFPYYEIAMRFLDLDKHLAGADLVVTAEGRIDRQSSRGKVPSEVACRAKQVGCPVVVLAGTISQDGREILGQGVDAFDCILQAPCSLPEAIRNTPSLLRDAAEQVMRLILVGSRIPRSLKH